MRSKPFVAHFTAIIESDNIGSGTRIWAFVHVLNGAIIGCDCNIGDHAYVEGNVKIGNQVVIKNGVSVWDGVTMEDRVFVGPNVAFTNDLVPRAKRHRAEWDRTLVKEGASLGANVTVVCGTTIGRFALVGAGSVVTRDVPDFALVYGNPARRRGWVCRCGAPLDFSAGSMSIARCKCGDSYRLHDDKVSDQRTFCRRACST